MKKMIVGALLVAECCTCRAAAVQNEPGAQKPSVKVTRQLVEQKESLVKRILQDSPAVRRIEASGNAEARKQLASAQENYRQALLAIQHGEYSTADAQLNEATRLIGDARQLVPDAKMRSIEEQERFSHMLKSVESLRVSYQKYLRRAKSPSLQGEAQLTKAAGLVDKARGLAESRQLGQATRLLSDAEHTLMVGMSQVLGSKTIEYALRFDNPVEEYEHELERNKSYADLIPIALAEFKPGSEAIREVQLFLDNNRQLREQAERHAAKKDHRTAVMALLGGTAYLQSALAAAGLRVPLESKPRGRE
jgi:hypothetical protein